MGERVHGYGLLILVHQAVPTPAEGDLRLLSEMVHLAGNTVRGAVAIVTRGVGHATPAALIAMAGADTKAAVTASAMVGRFRPARAAAAAARWDRAYTCVTPTAIYSSS